MSFSRLLAAGKSMVGMPDAQSPYRMRPENLLPKFESAKNPFAATTEPSKLHTPIPAAQIPSAPKVAPMETYPLFDTDLKPIAANASEVVSAGKMVPVCTMSDLGVVNEKPAAEVLAVARQYLDEISSSHRRLPQEEITVGLMDAHPLGLKTGTPARETLPEPVVAPAKAKQPSQPAPKPEPESRRAAAGAPVKLRETAREPKAKKIGLLSRLMNFARLRRPQIAAPRQAVQTELSLDRVKVVRNDLCDADLELVTIRRSGSKGGTGLRLQPMTEGEGGGFSRFASRIFGTGQTLAR